MNDHVKNVLIAAGGIGTAVATLAGWYEAKLVEKPVNTNINGPLLNGTPEEHAKANSVPVIEKNYQGSGEEPDKLRHDGGW